MSYAQRFMQKKETVPDAEGWQQVGGSRVTEYGGGSQRKWDNEGGGRGSRLAEHGGGSRVTEYGGGGFPSAFSKPKREERPVGMSWTKPQPPKPKEVNLDSVEDFPSLGGAKPKAAAAPTVGGWAAKAASWAAADEAEAAAERRRQLEQEEADKERRRLTSGIPDLLGTILRRRGDETYRGGFQEPMDDDYEDRARSPPYDPDYELAEYAAASAPNPHLHDEDADDDGWNESR